MGVNSKGNGSSFHKGNGKTRLRIIGLERLNAAQQLEFVQIREMVGRLPDIRSDRVNTLAHAIENGTYVVSSQQIAEAILAKNWVYRIH